MNSSDPTPTPAQADAVPEAVPTRQADDCNVICPYCGYAYQAEAQDFQDRERKELCGQCERTYLLYDDVTVTHYTRPLPTQP